MVKAATRALARCAPSHLGDSLVRSARAGAIVGLLATVTTGVTAASDSRNVLLLNASTRTLPANIARERGLRIALGNIPNRHVELYAEFLDVPRFDGESYARTVASFLRDKYLLHPPDVMVVAGDNALSFLLDNRAMIFPHTPVVYMGIPLPFLKSLPALPSDVIGIPVEYDSLRTIDLAFRLNASATRLVIVTGTSEWDKRWEFRLRSEVPKFPTRATPEFLAGLSTEAVRQRLAELGKDAVIFTPGYYEDAEGSIFNPRASAGIVAVAAAAPVFGPFDTFIGTGVVGGYMPSYEDMGYQAGEIVNALLDGSAPATLRLPATTPTALNVDWRQVQRWDLDENMIPKNAVVHFREPTFWERYRNVALITIAAVLVQAALIAALLIERRSRRRTAAALAESEQRMSLATRAAGVSTWVWDVSRDKILALPPSQQSTGRSRKSPERRQDVLETVHPADRVEFERAIRRAVAESSDLDIEYRMPGPDGEVRWIAARGRPEHGHHQRLLGVAVDVTERKVAELQASKDRAELRHVTRVSLLGQLSASIAHQLNQPLAAILGNAEAAQKMLGRGNVDLAELRGICDDIVSEDHRASQVIRRLGELYKRGDAKTESLDLNELVGETLELVRNELVARQVTAVTELASRLPSIEGGRVQLQQVLLNLILNAVDAMSENIMEQRMLVLRTEATASGVSLYVVDSGPGIAAEDLNHVFDPFWTTKSGGMGMGLAICQTIVASHRGSITVANNAGGGTTFCVTLPIARSP
jgi:C4-dicarboxylate-specific signal transduction histidine kinase